MKQALTKTWNKILNILDKNTLNVYFVSGMCYNCSCFDDIILPSNCNKIYLEWLIPIVDESFENYAKRLSNAIDTKKSFILVGYSLGGMIVQEISQFLAPLHTIIISSIKKESEIPSIFHLAQKIDFANLLPERLYNSPNLIFNIFNRYFLHSSTTSLDKYLTVNHPIYIKWAMKSIYIWKPKIEITNITHIHGTKDQVFPFELIDECVSIKAGDHLMIIKRSKQINNIINNTIMNYIS